MAGVADAAQESGRAAEGALELPGVSLYYKSRGTGPLLLILQGGAGDAEGSDGVAAGLWDRYTVVTYDRRGISRSALGTGESPPTIRTHADDAHHLLAALTAEPALVAGFSFGALVGLDLASRYPEQVRALVSHEAPTPHLLPEPERSRAVREQVEVETAFRLEGVAAMRRFIALTGVSFDDREPGVQLPAPGAHYTANVQFFLQYDAAAARTYAVDQDALKRAADRGTHIIPAAGTTNRDRWIHHCAAALAATLEAPLVEFPGGHNGFVTHPAAFSARLREVLGG